MTVSELMSALEQFDPDADVHIGSQPAWPLEHGLSYNVTESEGVVFLGEGAFIGYLQRDVADEVWA